MKPSEFGERQNKMILEATLSDSVLAQRFGCRREQISLHRTKLKRMQQRGQQNANQA